jgi:hypothetical protein
VTRDVAFEERRTWSWDTVKLTDKVSTPPSFPVEYAIEHKEEEGMQSPVAAAESVVSGLEMDTGTGSVSEPAAETPAREPVTPSRPGMEFATPPSHDSNLDIDSVCPHRYRRITNLYDATFPLEEEEEETLGLITTEKPASLEVALSNPVWRSAMEAELKSIEANATWSPSSLPKGHRANSMKWVFKVKRDPTGAIVKHKARLVVKGYA